MKKGDRSGYDVIVQSAVPDYRIELISDLRLKHARRLLVISGGSHFSGSVVAADSPSTVDLKISNRYVANRRLLIQPGAIWPGVAASTAVLEFNPRIISTWAVVLMRRLANRPTVLWGHVEGFGGSSRVVRWLRRALIMIARNLVVYSDPEAALARQSYRDATVHVAPNGLYSLRHPPIHPATGTCEPLFIYSGRLVESKKVDRTVEAFLRALRTDQLPSSAVLRVVGDGPEADRLHELVRRNNADKSVILMGGVAADDYDSIAGIYDNATASICSGYVGLNAVQSLWFGVPMIAALGQPHAPEIHCLKDGSNALLAARNSVESISACIARAWREREWWRQRRQAVSSDCRRRFSVEATSAGILEAIREAQPV
jgi:glycosyltransferase involved in cell wall biosynthesis